jgi:hypothetical protein
MRKLLTALLGMLVSMQAPVAAPAEEAPAWTIVLHPADYVIGPALSQLHTRRTWVADFDERFGGFEIAVRKKAVPIAAPQCRMDHLILKIPFYYPENPKQASVSERRAVYDAFATLQAAGAGSVTARVEAPEAFARKGPRGVELTSCSLLFAFPLSVQAAPR